MPVAERVALAWSIHGVDPEGVAASLPDMIEACDAQHAPSVAGLVVHVLGEHLGRWEEGLACLAALPADPSVSRSVAALEQAAGRGTDLEGSDRARVLAIAASAVAGHGRVEEAGAWLEEAEGIVRGLADDDPAVRVTAISANNLATVLLDLERDAAGDGLLRRSAALALRAWRRAGTWHHELRAEILLAKASASLRAADDSVKHANRAIQIGTGSQAPALDMLLAYEALGLALLASGNEVGAGTAARGARALLGDVESLERAGAEEALDALDRSVAEAGEG